jgi:hypothetical protein
MFRADHRRRGEIDGRDEARAASEGLLAAPDTTDNPATACFALLRTAWPTTTPIPSPRITSYAEPSRSLEKAATDRWSRPQRSRCGASGRIMVAGQNIKLGPRHRGKIVTVVIDDTHLRVLHGEEEIAVRPRRNLKPITRFHVTGAGANNPSRKASPDDNPSKIS